MSANSRTADMYRRCLRGEGMDVPTKHGNLENQGMPLARGKYLRCRSTEPPPAADYDAWLKSQRHAGPRGQHGKATVTGEKLRRVVRMVRNGYSKAEAGRSNGMSPTYSSKMLGALPPELAP